MLVPTIIRLAGGFVYAVVAIIEFCTRMGGLLVLSESGGSTRKRKLSHAAADLWLSHLTSATTLCPPT